MRENIESLAGYVLIELESGKEFNSIKSKNIHIYFHAEMLDWMKQKPVVCYPRENVKAFFGRMKKEIRGPIWCIVCDGNFR